MAWSGRWRCTVCLLCSLGLLTAYFLFVACAVLHFYVNRGLSEEHDDASEHTCRLPGNTTGYDTTYCDQGTRISNNRAAHCALSCSAGYVGTPLALCSQTGGVFELVGCALGLAPGCAASASHELALSPGSCEAGIGFRIASCTVNDAFDPSCAILSDHEPIGAKHLTRSLESAQHTIAYMTKRELEQTVVAFPQSDLMVNTSLASQRINSYLDLEDCLIEAWLPLADPETRAALAALALDMTVDNDLDGIHFTSPGRVETLVKASVTGTVRAHVRVPLLGTIQRRFTLSGTGSARLSMAGTLNVTGLRIEKPSRSGHTAVVVNSVMVDFHAELPSAPSVEFQLDRCHPFRSVGIDIDICVPAIRWATPRVEEEVHRLASKHVQVEIARLEQLARRKVESMCYFEFDHWGLEFLCYCVGCDGRSLQELVHASTVFAWVLVALALLLLVLLCALAWLQRERCQSACRAKPTAISPTEGNA